VEELSNKHPDVVFLKVDADQNADLVQRSQVSAFPTFQFYVNGAKVDEMKGANPTSLESKLNALKTSAGGNGGGGAFGGRSNTVGASSSAGVQPPVAWDGVGPPPVENARAARLKAFGHLDAKQRESIYKERPTAAVDSGNSTSSASVELNEDDAIARAIGILLYIPISLLLVFC
jgi:hypothetical protein